jgi:signal transduction histidine kinase
MSAHQTKQPLERQIAAAIMAAAIIAAIAAVVLALLLPLGPVRSTNNANASVDAVASALARGVAPQPLLDTLTASGTIRAATVYGANGTRLASSGSASPDAEQIYRSLPAGGSVSIEPSAPSAHESSRKLIEVAAVGAGSALLISIVAAWLVTSMLRRRIDTLTAGVDDAIRDQAYATRLQPESGILHPLTNGINKLLDQTQQRDLATRRRMTELEAANKDLESFAATVSHDLRAPVGSIAGFAQALDEDYGPKLDDLGRECIHWIRQGATQMSNFIEGMLQMARLSRAEVHRTAVDISGISREIAGNLSRAHPDRDVEFVVPAGITTSGDEQLLRAVLENLIGNAFKFTGKRSGARIEIGSRDDDGTLALYVRDNGAGFAPEYASKMFRPFQRLHSEKEFSGTGIGLATVQRIVQRHGGRVWAEGEPDKGATVYFTTGTDEGDMA